MKIAKSLISSALACLFSYGATAQSSFSYSFYDVYSLNALDYIVGQNNIERSSENGNPADGISYWNPINNGQTASLTFEFTFAQPTASIFLNASIATYNFDGNEFGSGSLWASTDGANWVQLENAPTPAYPGYPYGWSSIYDANLPASLTGASEIWLQVQLESSGRDIMAQFLRQDTSWNTANIFELDATIVPEPSALALTLIGGLGVFCLRWRNSGINRG